MHDRGDRMRVEYAGQCSAVSGVGCGDDDPGSEFFKFARQVVCAATAEQHEVPDTMVGDQMPGEQAAEPARRAGDQDRALAEQPGDRCEPDQTWGDELPVPDRELWFHRGGPDRRSGHRTVHKGQTVGVLGLRGPQQAPDRRGGGVVDGVPGDDDQVRPGEPLVGQPALDEGEHPLRDLVGCLDHRPGCGTFGDHHGRNRGEGGESGRGPGAL